MESCLNELSNQQLQENGTLNPYYVQVEETEVEETKKQIKSVLDTAADKNFITAEELKAMLADDKNPAKFYQLFKVHKTHIPGDTPPSRPVISGSGSYKENISLFVDSFLKPFPTYTHLIFRILQIFLEVLKKLTTMIYQPTLFYSL